MTRQEPLLDVRDLRVSFKTYAGEVKAVRGVSFTVSPGETLAIVGESGCGKTVTSKAIMGLMQDPGYVHKESAILFEGRDILQNSKKEWRSYRGSQAGMIFQDPMTALDPTMRVGAQIAEGMRKHKKIGKKAAKEETLQLLRLVNVPNPETRMIQYPFEFSGGMRQRIVIAIALACNPKLLIADEPTTALDVTIQADILDLLRSLKEQTGSAVILITHDFGVVAGIADKIVVMYAGLVVESGSVTDVFKRPAHPYTKALLQSVPHMNLLNKQELVSIPGTPPDLFAPPPGCPFADRCPECMKICQMRMPDKTEFPEGHTALCWLHHPYARRDGGEGV